RKGRGAGDAVRERRSGRHGGRPSRAGWMATGAGGFGLFFARAVSLACELMAKQRGGEVLAFSSFKPETLRGRAGFCRVGRTWTGQWWFIDAEGRPFWLKAVGGGAGHEDAEQVRSYGMDTISVRWDAGAGEG